MLQFIKFFEIRKNNRYGLFLCGCGNKVIVAIGNVTTGHTTSCGCYKIDLAIRQNTTHGQTNTPTYRTWLAMRTRCTNRTRTFWKYYGGRGIKICKRWKQYESFVADMGIRPKGKTLDRINPDGNYEPDNCRWATPKQQTRNRRVRTIS